MKIFISSTYGDLKDYRRAVRGAILRLGHHPIGMEDFGSRPETPKQAALDAIYHCDIFIGIYAHRYGSISPGDSLSIVEQEFDRARELDIPCYVYVIDPNFDWQGPMDDEDNTKHLARFKTKIDKLLRSTFTTPNDLAVKVASDLGRDFPKEGTKSNSFFEQEQFELARKLLQLSTDYKKAYGIARGFLVFDNETVSRRRNEGESPRETRLLNEQYARLNRIWKVGMALDELNKLIPEAEEILQPDIAEFIAPLSRESVLLFDSIYYYYPEELRLVRGEITEIRDPEEHDLYLKTMRAPHPRAAYNGERDEVGERVAEHLEKLRAVLRKYLRPSR